MKLLRLHLDDVGPLRDLTLSFMDGERGDIRDLTIIVGPPSTGKTSVLRGLAHVTPVLSKSLSRPSRQPSDRNPVAIADWILGDDAPDRPHPLRVATPGTRVLDDEKAETLRRREQRLFETRAAREGGFSLISLSGARWFSTTPTSLRTPSESLSRLDPRAQTSLDDPGSADLTKIVKTTLAYSVISAQLRLGTVQQFPPHTSPSTFGEAVLDVVNRFTNLAGYRFVTIDPSDFEPLFIDPRGETGRFDHLPKHVKHLCAFGALAVRGLHAAYAGTDPRMAQGVVVIDDLDRDQPVTLLPQIPLVMRSALPRVQWLLTCRNPHVAAACEPSAVIALRPDDQTGKISLYEGTSAIVH